MLDPILDSTVSPEAVETVKKAFTVAVTRELLILGTPAGTINKLLVGMTDRVETHTPSGARYVSRNATLLTAEATAADLLAAAAAAARVASFGPNPELLLAARLATLGLSVADATERAAERVQRLEDGRVAAYDRAGEVAYAGGFEARPDATAEELAATYDAAPAVTVACRSILSEYERGLPPYDAPPVVASPVASF